MKNRVLTNSKKAKLNTMTSILIKIVSLVSNFIMKTITIKYLGIEYAGVSSLFTDILTIFSFAELGIGSAIIFELYKPLREKEYPKIAQLMNFYKKAYQLIGLAILLAGVLSIPLLPLFVKSVPDIQENLTVIYILYVLNTVTSYFLIYKGSLLSANQEGYLISIIQVIFSGIRLLVGCFSIIIFKNFLLYLLLDIIIIVIQNIVIYLLADKKFVEIKKYDKELLPAQNKNALLKNVGALSLYQVSNVILNGTDTVVISALLGTGFVTFFANYRLIIRSVDSLVSQITVALTPTLGQLAIDGTESQKKNFSLLNLFVYWITLNTSLLLFFLIPPFIEFWLGKEFVMSEWLLLGFVVDYFFLNMVRIVATFRNANGLFMQGKYRPLIMSILNVVISVIFVKQFGVAGAIWGTIVSRVLTQVWFDPLVVFKYLFKESPVPYFIYFVKQFIIAIFIGIIIRYVINLFQCSNLLINLFYDSFIVLIICNFIFYFLFRKDKSFLRIMKVVMKNK
ncbi:hypothetical protein JZO76_01440 [Enterococcus sp. MJM12]|uniref:Uncharacterized protein n=1 Tax=Candidatus Enterococcus myersii TaxID=2815322 RepID=A0ABS3H413_9ENTE|nr:hypothetical protein [Enterococcus sp. MJM12]MBO0448190.1 hypothetical protein [Enterococcus sp. MJM12]